MSDRTCVKCNKVFDLPCRLKNHQKRKISCELIILNIPIQDKKNFKCKHCLRTFTTETSMYRHIRQACKIVNCPNKDSLLLAINSSNLAIVQKQVETLTNTVNNLQNNLKKENTNINNQGVIQNIETQNIQNNNITINCTILPYWLNKQTSLFIAEMNIKHDDLLSPFLKGNSAANEYAKISYLDKVDVKNSEGRLNPKGFIANQLISSAIIEMIENVYADSENDTSVVYLLKKDKVMVYQENGIWCVKSLDNVNRELCGNIVQNVRAMRDKIVYPKEVYNGEKVAINETFRDLPMEYGTAKPKGFIANTSKILKNSKNELSIILESNKDKLKNDKLI